MRVSHKHFQKKTCYGRQETHLDKTIVVVALYKSKFDQSLVLYCNMIHSRFEIE
jgi:hypothetical protein